MELVKGYQGRYGQKEYGMWTTDISRIDENLLMDHHPPFYQTVLGERRARKIWTSGTYKEHCDSRKTAYRIDTYIRYTRTPWDWDCWQIRMAEYKNWRSQGISKHIRSRRGYSLKTYSACLFWCVTFSRYLATWGCRRRFERWCWNFGGQTWQGGRDNRC